MFEMGIDFSVDDGFCIRLRHVLAVISKLVLILGCEKAPGLWAVW